jgi:hypothetical protein
MPKQISKAGMEGIRKRGYHVRDGEMSYKRALI